MIWQFCIRRPVLTTVFFLALIIFGLYSYRQMPVRENPDVAFPVISVNIVLAGAEPEVMETEVIEPLEEEINTLEGLKTLTSTAREQVATITAEFELWRDIDVAAQEVRDRIQRARRDLPDDIEAPVVSKLDPDAFAIMWITLQGDRRWDMTRLTEYADERIKTRLENLKGVGRVQVGGGHLYAVRLKLDPDLMTAHGVTVDDVVRTVRRNNVKIPSGRLTMREREFLVKTQGLFSSAEPFNDLIVAHRDGGTIRIRDVGRAVAGVENERIAARFNGRPSVGLGIVKQANANTVEVADQVKKRIEEMAGGFPAGLEYRIASDSSVYIQRSVQDLIFTIGLASSLVVLVVLSFLRSIRGTIITSLAIPASLLGGLTLINLLGFSLNQLTLLAFILAIGIVVDDAVVVLESNYRHMEEGDEPRQAARVGTSEVAFPSIANTVALAAVFLPVAFTGGMIGRFFYEFSLTVALTVFASTFTAVTLTPMLCSRLLKPPSKTGRWFGWTEKALAGVENGYARLLRGALRRRIIALLVALAVLPALVLVFFQLDKEFLPTVDRGEFILSFETPEGSTLDYTDRFARRIESIMKDHPAVDHFFLAIGLSQGGGPGKVNEGVSFVQLVPKDRRDRHQKRIMQDLRQRFKQVPGGRVYVLNVGVVGGQSGAPLQIVLQHDEFGQLAQGQERFMNWMRGRDEYVGVNSDFQLNKPQIEVDIHRDKASELGVDVAAVSNTLRLLLGQVDVSYVERKNKRRDVILETVSERMIPSDLNGIHLRAADGRLIRLGNLVDLTETTGPSRVHHYNRLRSATVSASTPPEVVLGQALARAEAWLADHLGAGFDYTVAGRAKDFQESFYYLSVALIFAVVFVYLTLAAQFESFVYPFIILLALPLAGIGAFGALWLLDMPFSIYAFIGVIMLTGMAAKNAILLIDYTNVLRARGLELFDAVQRASQVRFRPVIMTTLSTVLGLLPIALGYGAGGEARAPLGVAVASGLLVTTLLTLVAIPVVYALLERTRARLTRRGPEQKGGDA